MPDAIYSKDPVPVRSRRKPYLVILLAVVTVFVLQVAVRLLSSRPRESAGHLIEDPNRKVFKEQDIVREIQGFGRRANESLLARLEQKAGLQKDEARERQYQRLGPISFHREEKTQGLAETGAQGPPEPIGLPLGTKMIALLKDKIFSFNVENQVEAELLKDVYYLGKLRLPKGTRFFGSVGIVHSEDRVNIHFHRLLLPWGEERSVRAVAHSPDGSGGIKGKVHRKWLLRSFSIVGKTALGAMTLFTVPNRQSALSIEDRLRLTGAANLSQEASQELNQLQQQAARKAISVKSDIPIKIVLLESI